MGSLSLAHWLIISVILLLLFGAGRVPLLMGDLAKGIKSFKAGLADEPVLPKSLPASAGDQDRPER